jgi:hypothetical protein
MAVHQVSSCSPGGLCSSGGLDRAPVYRIIRRLSRIIRRNLTLTLTLTLTITRCFTALWLYTGCLDAVPGDFGFRET